MIQDCEHYRKRIPPYLLGDVGSAEQAELERHLADCPGCRSEHAQYVATLDALQSVADAPLPRHFFVHPAGPRPNPWRSFRQLGYAWQLSMATAALLFLAVSAAALTRVRIGLYDGILYAGFGRLPPAPAQPVPPPVDADALEARILAAAERRWQEADLTWMSSLRQELAQSLQGLSSDQRRLVQAALADVEERINGRIAVTARNLQADAAASRLELYQIVSLERGRDMSLLNNRLDQLAVAHEVQTNQTDAILDTLIQVADYRLGTTPGGQK